jgi:hypothetical protein
MDMQRIKVYDVCVIVWVVSSILKACVALLSKGQAEEFLGLLDH